MAARYVPFGGKQTYMSDFEKANLASQQQNVANQLAAIKAAYSIAAQQRGQDIASKDRAADLAFRKEDSAAGREFTASENMKKRQFTTSERLSEQDFTAGQNRIKSEERRRIADRAYELELRGVESDEAYNIAMLEGMAEDRAARIAGDEFDRKQTMLDRERQAERDRINDERAKQDRARQEEERQRALGEDQTQRQVDALNSEIEVAQLLGDDDRVSQLLAIRTSLFSDITGLPLGESQTVESSDPVSALAESMTEGSDVQIAASVTDGIDRLDWMQGQLPGNDNDRFASSPEYRNAFMSAQRMRASDGAAQVMAQTGLDRRGAMNAIFRAMIAEAQSEGWDNIVRALQTQIQ